MVRFGRKTRRGGKKHDFFCRLIIIIILLLLSTIIYFHMDFFLVYNYQMLTIIKPNLSPIVIISSISLSYVLAFLLLSLSLYKG